jgi:multidrug resistance efflux pump
VCRPSIRSPVNGYVTNLLAQLGDYANVAQKIISVVDADSFWVDGYFEETSLGRIHEGDPATLKLMGYSQVVRGHVGGVARGINIPNAQPDQAGLASVNPIFTWVRLAQRVPVRIHIDQVPDGVRLVAGMTATCKLILNPNRQPASPGGWVAVWLGRTAADLSRNLGDDD